MISLYELGLKEGWIYEVAVCTFSGQTPHAAPIGVWTNDLATLQMDLYEGSRTLRNVLERGELVADFPHDAATLATALLAGDELEFADARGVRAPRLRDASASVELLVRQTTDLSGRVRVAAEPVHVHRGPSVRLINRAEGLLIESLILATRLDRLDRATTLRQLTENYRVVRKVAPGSVYERELAALTRDLAPLS